MTLSTITAPIPRDRWNRPLVTPPGGGKPVAYTRCTRYVDALEDTYNLSLWQQRMVAIGLIDRPDLQLAVAAHRDDKSKLNGIVAEAMEAARAHAAATTGTALHALTETYDRGQPLPTVPPAHHADLDAYIEATKPLTIIPDYIERFMVYDELRIGGTPDRIVELGGRRYIADLKTGGIDYAMGKIAQQLAVYAHSTIYNHHDGTRERVDGIDLDTAIVIHLPAGSGTCHLVEVDIDAGWEAVQLSTQVRAWRKRKDLHRPLNAVGAAKQHRIVQLINSTNTAEELADLYHQHKQAWTDELTAHAAKRKADLADNN